MECVNRSVCVCVRACQRVCVCLLVPPFISAPAVISSFPASKQRGQGIGEDRQKHFNGASKGERVGTRPFNLSPNQTDHNNEILSRTKKILIPLPPLSITPNTVSNDIFLHQALCWPVILTPQLLLRPIRRAECRPSLLSSLLL